MAIDTDLKRGFPNAAATDAGYVEEVRAAFADLRACHGADRVCALVEAVQRFLSRKRGLEELGAAALMTLQLGLVDALDRLAAIDLRASFARRRPRLGARRRDGRRGAGGAGARGRGGPRVERYGQGLGACAVNPNRHSDERPPRRESRSSSSSTWPREPVRRAAYNSALDEPS